MPNEPADILTIEEVAAYLRIPVSSVYKLAQEGKIPAQKVGRHWRFHRLTLEKWITGEGLVGSTKPDTSDTNHG
ncbi:MAG: helix-turn-helix domain-containing protein [Anaerolineaceae bacterium]|nr:helix-turn-helix domain-containing protein [Anaerolineaceae bacterium]